MTYETNTPTEESIIPKHEDGEEYNSIYLSRFEKDISISQTLDFSQFMQTQILLTAKRKALELGDDRSSINNDPYNIRRSDFDELSEYTASKSPSIISEASHNSPSRELDDSGDENTSKLTGTKQSMLKARNRQAAQKCRIKKKKYLQTLQDQVNYYTSENKELLQSANDLREEIIKLRTLVFAHRDCPVSKACSKALFLMGKEKPLTPP
ncbi:Transcription factor atf31 [Schizosaccharomyces pombe]